MADELTLQLDKLIKEMQYPTAKKKKRRRKKKRNEVVDHQLESGWNNSASPHMSKLPNYDALRDPHCTYTRKRQFRIHHERYKQVAVMSEILRGDHADLKDVLGPAMDTPRDRKGRRKKAVHRNGLPSVKRRKRKKTPKSQHNNVIQNQQQRMKQKEKIYESSETGSRRSTQPSGKRSKRSGKHRSTHRKVSQYKGHNDNKRYNAIGPNGDDSRGVIYDNNTSKKNSLSNPLPPLSPQSFGELKPPSMNDKNSPWQRRRDFNLGHNLERFRAQDQEEEERMRKKIIKKKKERSLRKDKKSKKVWRQRMKTKLVDSDGSYKKKGSPTMLKPLKSSSITPLDDIPGSTSISLQAKNSPNKGGINTIKKGTSVEKNYMQQQHNYAEEEINLSTIDAKRNFVRPEAAETSSMVRGNGRGRNSGLVLKPNRNNNDDFFATSNNDFGNNNNNAMAFDIFDNEDDSNNNNSNNNNTNDGGSNIQIRAMGNEPVIADVFKQNEEHSKKKSPETNKEEDNYSDSEFEDDFEEEEEEEEHATTTTKTKSPSIPTVELEQPQLKEDNNKDNNVKQEDKKKEDKNLKTEEEDEMNNIMAVDNTNITNSTANTMASETTPIKSASIEKPKSTKKKQEHLNKTKTLVDLEEAIGFLEDESNSNINIKNNDTNVKGDNTTVNDAFDAELDALMNGLEDSSENNAVINDKEVDAKKQKKKENGDNNNKNNATTFENELQSIVDDNNKDNNNDINKNEDTKPVDKNEDGNDDDIDAEFAALMEEVDEVEKNLNMTTNMEENATTVTPQTTTKEQQQQQEEDEFAALLKELDTDEKTIKDKINSQVEPKEKNVETAYRSSDNIKQWGQPLSSNNELLVDEIGVMLKTESDELILAICNAMESEIVFTGNITKQVLVDISDWEQEEFLKSLMLVLNQCSEVQLASFISSLIRTLDNSYTAMDTQLHDYSKTCGADDVTAEEAYHQVKSIPLLQLQLDAIKFSTLILKQIYTNVERASRNIVIRRNFISTVLNSLISHIAPGLNCATFSEGPRKWNACKKYIERLNLPNIQDYYFLYNALSKSIFLHVKAYSSGEELNIKLKVYRDKALKESLEHAKQTPKLLETFINGANHTGNNGGNHKNKGPVFYPMYYRDADGSIEEGEGYGPRKEFFALIGQQLVKELENNTTPFVYQKSCESFWPNNKYADEASLKWIGFILGCSFTSKCPLGISMPELFFKYLLDDHYRPTLEDVQSFNEEIYNAMVSIQKMDDGKYLEVLQADFYEDNMKRDEYIKVSLEERLYQPIQWQLKMLGEGFKSVINSDMLTTTGATPFDFHKITLGGEGSINKNFQIRDIFKIATDSEMEDWPMLEEVFWNVIENFNLKQKRNFIKFVTGVDKLPYPKSEVLRIEMPFMSFSTSEARENYAKLPSAHTCTSTLEIPNYLECLLKTKNIDSMDSVLADNTMKISIEKELKLHIEKKLKFALDSLDGMGYGLDDIKIDGDTNPSFKKKEIAPKKITTPRQTITFSDDSDEDDGSFDIPMFDNSNNTTNENKNKSNTPNPIDTNTTKVLSKTDKNGGNSSDNNSVKDSINNNSSNNNNTNNNKITFDDSYDSDSSFGSLDIPMISDDESPRF